MTRARTSTLDATQNRKPAHGHVAAILLMCCAVTVFSFIDASAKYLVDVLGVPVVQVAWVRFTNHALLTLSFFAPYFVKNSMRPNKPAHQIFRSFLLALTTGFNFAAVKYLQLDQTVTIFFLSPLLVAALAGPILGEWVGWRRLLAILTGFTGVLLVTRPGFGGIHWAVIYMFGAVTTYSLYSIHTRYMAAHDSPEVTLLYTPLAGAVLFCPFALAIWQWPEGWLTWALFVLIGATGALGTWFLILSLRFAPAPVVAPFVYVGLISMSGLGYFIFGDVPTPWTLSGGAIVVASGLYLLYRERATS